MILDEDMTQNLRKELKEKLNEKNLEGLNGFEYLRRTKKCKTPLQKKNGELIALRDARRKDT